MTTSTTRVTLSVTHDELVALIAAVDAALELYEDSDISSELIALSFTLPDALVAA